MNSLVWWDNRTIKSYQVSIANHYAFVYLQVYLMCRESWEHLAPAPACSPGSTQPGSPGWTLLIPLGWSWTGWTSSRSQCCRSTRYGSSGPTMTMWIGQWLWNRHPSPDSSMPLMIVTLMEYTPTTPSLPSTRPCPAAKVSSTLTCPTWAVPVP